VNKEAEVLQGVWKWEEIQDIAKSLGCVKEFSNKQQKKRGRPRGNKNLKNSVITDDADDHEDIPEEMNVEEQNFTGLNPQGTIYKECLVFI